MSRRCGRLTAETGMRSAMPVNSIPVESKSGLDGKLERRWLTSATRFNCALQPRRFYLQYGWLQHSGLGRRRGARGNAAKSSSLEYFGDFSETVQNFNVTFYTFIYRFNLSLHTKQNLIDSNSWEITVFTIRFSRIQLCFYWKPTW